MGGAASGVSDDFMGDLPLMDEPLMSSREMGRQATPTWHPWQMGRPAPWNTMGSSSFEDAQLPSLPDAPMASEERLYATDPEAMMNALFIRGPSAPDYPPPAAIARGQMQPPATLRRRYGNTPGTSVKITSEPASAPAAKGPSQALAFARALGFDVDGQADEARVQAAFKKATRGMKVAQLLNPKNLAKSKALFAQLLAAEPVMIPSRGPAGANP